MHEDTVGVYRTALEDDPPRFEDRVDTPWDRAPDLAAYNETAYNRLVRCLNALRRSPGGEGYPKSHGMLILGEAGTGKTHLLMRVARNLSRNNHILFVRKPNNEDAVAQHVWTNIINSLAKPIPAGDSQTSQLDDLLAHVFTKVLVPGFEQDVRERRDPETRRRWVNDLQEDPANLFRMLGEGERRQTNMETIRRRTLRHLQQSDPDVDQDIARALVMYCFVRSDDRKRVLLTWLSGQDVGEDEAAALGLPPTWVPVDETSADSSTQQQREERALRAIRSLGILSTYYQPLILAFDQLEGLRGEERLTQRWGDVVRELFTMTPNTLIVTCIFPSLWETWFQQALDQSTTERVSQQTVTLETFASHHATPMLAAILEPSFRRHRLPSSIFPFTELDVQALCADATSPRVFIQRLREAFNTWLDGDVHVVPAGPAGRDVMVSQTSVDEVIRRTIESCKDSQRTSYGREIPIEQDLFGRVRNLTQVLLQGSEGRVAYDRAAWAHYVMPPTMIVRDKVGGRSLCVAVMNSEGNSFTARLRNLRNASIDATQYDSLVILRDRRCRQIGPRAQEYLQELELSGARFVHAGVDEMVALHALYDTLVAVEEHDLSVGPHEVDKAQFVAYARAHGLLMGIEFFRQMASLSPIMAGAVGAANTTPPHGSRIADVRQAPPRAPQPALSPDSSAPAPSPAASAVRSGPAQPRATSGPGPILQVLVGDRHVDSPHAGVLGQLEPGGHRLGISLAKPQCIALMGYMGSGKSYALGVLIENALLGRPEIVRQSRPMAVVAFNFRQNPEARFEYGGFAQANTERDEERRLLLEYGARPTALPRTNVFAYREELPRRRAEYGGLNAYPLQFTPAELAAEHWEILMKPPSPGSEYMDVVRDVIQKLHYQERLSFRTLQHQIQADDRLSESQRRQAMNRMSFASRWIVDERPYDWESVLEDGSLSVVDLRMQAMQASEALKLCLIVTDIVRRTRNGVNKMIIFDEAHEYVDCKELVAELENAITQIRHDGMSFVLASQIPERIPERIFRYLLTRLIFKLPHAKSIDYVRKAAPNLEALPRHAVADLGLEAGTCFVQTDDDCTDALLRTPQLLRVRPRCTLHSGTTQRSVRAPGAALDGELPAAPADLEKYENVRLADVCAELGCTIPELLVMCGLPGHAPMPGHMTIRESRLLVAYYQREGQL